ncbi:hypothetical protein EGW08_011817 [Elysia chlorotica]|uniref:DOMON domain-containing protein n=1 Tax=Elysia chlorotica TaxID=188477 RepID=A0A3S1B5M5_ELYCH|nr:hypothetical protein EGW08_011817 [Elysia chlorotica]
MIKFHLTAKISSGSWFAIGFSDYGEVTSADLLVFWSDAEGVNHLVDAHTDERGILRPDTSQDYHVTAVSSSYTDQGQGRFETFLKHHPGFPRSRASQSSGQSSDESHVDRGSRRKGHTELKDYLKFRDFRRNTWRSSHEGQVRGERSGHSRRSRKGFLELALDFQRKFLTCDVHDYAIDNGTTHVIYMEGILTGSSPLGQPVTSLKHGLQRVQILKPEVVQPPFPEDTWTFEVRAPRIKVPATETTYWWHTTRLPDIPQRHHIIKYEGIIAPGSEDLVHHMEVFHCVTHKGGIPYFSGPGLGEGKPAGLGVCRHVIGAWAMGAQAMVYPEQAGVPVGGGGVSRYVLLEIHYNNPHKKPGIVDTSGIRFYVTSHLRQFEAGIMELGLEYTNKMAIPPRQTRFSLSGYCVPECTAKVSNYSINVERRTATELPELNKDSHYSSHFQEIRRLEPPVAVMPVRGQRFTTLYTCRNKHVVTLITGLIFVLFFLCQGGFSISDEMCVNYIHYYPKTDLEVCKSSVETKALDTFLFFLNR